MSTRVYNMKHSGLWMQPLFQIFDLYFSHYFTKFIKQNNKKISFIFHSPPASNTTLPCSPVPRQWVFTKARTKLTFSTLFFTILPSISVRSVLLRHNVSTEACPRSSRSSASSGEVWGLCGPRLKSKLSRWSGSPSSSEEDIVEVMPKCLQESVQRVE